MKMKRTLCGLLALVFIMCCLFVGCGSSKETILIYTSTEDYVLEDMQLCLNERFPQYNIIIEYLPTGDHAAKLLAEGKNTDCDIIHNLEYPYLQMLEKNGLLADLTGIADSSIFAEDVLISDYYHPQCRNGGAIIINTQVMSEKGLPVPACYDDLLDPIYNDLISMPNPKSSGTGFMFLMSMISSRGEDAAFEYFDKFSENVFQFTSSGSGPVNALVQGEAAIGLGITGHAVEKINSDNAPLEIIFFEEGSPCSMYGQGIPFGKDERECVKEVYQYMAEEYSVRYCEEFYPEPIFADKTFIVENFPEDIKYADMKDTTPEDKERLLAKWKY